MRNTIIATSLTILVGVSSVGCKSMPKTASTSAAETASLASTEPIKPSVLAKQAEGLAAAGDAAPAFVPNLSSTPPAVLAATPAATGYPSTTASAFSPALPASQSLAVTAPAAGLGSIQLPYNPDAVPPAASAVAKTVAPVAPSRYMAASTPTSTLPTSANPEVSEAPKTASRYGGYLATVQAAQQSLQAPSTDHLPPAVSASPAVAQAEAVVAQTASENNLSTPVAGSMQEIATNAASSLAGRYGQAVPPAYAPAPPVAAAIMHPAPTTPTPQAVASTTPYRPGGTSSYPTTGFTPPSMIATRPESPHPQVPNAETPGISEPVPYPVTPQVPRYR